MKTEQIRKQKYTVIGYHRDNGETTLDHVTTASVPDAIDRVALAVEVRCPGASWESRVVLVGHCHLAPINWCLACGSIGVDRDVSRCDIADHHKPKKVR